MRARRLQQVYWRRFEIRRTLRAAKDERHLLSCLTTVHHCLFLRPHHSWIHGSNHMIFLVKFGINKHL